MLKALTQAMTLLMTIEIQAIGKGNCEFNRVL